MVTRRLGIALGVSIPLLLVVAGLAWLLGTASGAAWLFGRLSAWTPVQIRATEVDGRLAGHLQLQGLEVEWATGVASATELSWQLSPASLLGGGLRLHALTAKDVVVALSEPDKDQSPAEPPSPLDLEPLWTSWPSWTDWFSLHVTELHLDGLKIRLGTEDVFVLPKLVCGLDWADKRFDLVLHDLTLPWGQASGKIWLMPTEMRGEVQLDGQAVEAWQGIKTVSTGWTLMPAGEHRLQGDGAVTVRGTTETLAVINTRLTLEPQRLQVERLHAERPQRSDRLDLAGVLKWNTGEAVWSSHVKAKDLDLNDWQLPLKLTGEVEGQGRSDHYQGQVDLANANPTWVVEQLAGHFDGDSRQVAVTELHAGLLQGTVSGSGEVGWHEGVRVRADLQGRQLNPNRFVADLDATVNVDAAGSWVQDSSGGAWQVRADLLPSTWRGHAVHGQVLANGTGAEVVVENLQLQGDGLRLHAFGPLAERLDYELQATNLAPWWPNLSGTANATGWLQWRDGRPAGELQGKADRLVWDDMQLNSLQVQAKLQGLLEDVDLHLHGAGFRYGEESLQRVEVNLAGNRQNHHGDLTLTWPSGDLLVQLNGRLADGIWQGRITALNIREKDVGIWSLGQPTEVMVGQSQIQVPDFVLHSDKGEEVDLAADLTLNPLTGSTSAQWRRLNLEGFNPWLSFMSLTGVSSGQMEAKWRPDKPPIVKAKVEVQTVVELADGRIPVDEGVVDLDWGDDGLIGFLSLDLGEQGSALIEATAGGPVCFGCPPRSRLQGEWDKLDLSLFNPWLPLTLSGNSCGKADVTLEETRLAVAQLTATTRFGLKYDEFELTDARLQLTGKWDPAGLQLDNDLALQDGGRMTLRLASSDGPRWSLPAQGEVQGDWNELQLSLAQAWLPPTLQLVGNWNGQLTGGWQGGETVQLELGSEFNKGELSWSDEAGQLMATDLNGTLNGRWTDGALAAAADINLSKQGRLTADATLPLSNRFPFSFDSQAPWQSHLTLQGRESGLLSAVLPGLVEETKGQFDLQVQAAGSPADPSFSGSASLQEAAGTIPALGVRLDDVELQAKFANDQLRIDRLALKSGKGTLQGEGTVDLDGWQLVKQHWTLQGKDMPLVRLPELELFVSPDLQGDGTAQELAVRGKILVPRMLLSSLSGQGEQPVKSSPDVVIVDAQTPSRQEWPFKLDAQVRVELGDHVLINTAGVDARLTGAVDLKVRGPQDMTGSGEISVAQGTYSGYGIRLPIERGRVLFSGGPLDRPTLDILAVRTVGEVKAGVKVTGTPRKPLVTLYSDPSMPDTDKLSYIVLGRPLGSDSGQTDVLMLAAGALLSKGESAALQDSLQRRLGVDIKVDSGEGDVGNSVITIGKYLRPDLYVSLGYSIFTQTNEVRLRYNLTKKLELQSNMGVESGADLYYRVDFE